MRDKRGAYFDVDGFLHIAPDYFDSLLATVIVCERMSPVLFLSIHRRVNSVKIEEVGMRTRMERAIRMATPSTQSTGPAWPLGSRDLPSGTSLTPIPRLE